MPSLIKLYDGGQPLWTDGKPLGEDQVDKKAKLVKSRFRKSRPKGRPLKDRATALGTALG
jgi:hypothetical protein